MKKSELEDIITALENPFFEAQHLSPTALYNRLKIPPVVNRSIKLTSWKKDETPSINYQSIETPLGPFLIAATEKGICFLAPLTNNKIDVLADFYQRFGFLNPIKKENEHIAVGRNYLNTLQTNTPLSLHVKATTFQLNIWNRLLEIPFGGLTTYSRIGGGEKYGRATGSAVGTNPVCFIIPCHRVIRESGKFDGFYWGNELKKAFLVWENNH